MPKTPERLIVVLIILWGCTAPVFAQTEQPLNIISDFKITSEQQKIYITTDRDVSGKELFSVNKKPREFQFLKGKAPLDFETGFEGRLILLKSDSSSYKLYHISRIKREGYRIKHIPLWLSVIPPLLAIIFALLTREVMLSLFIGLWSGAFIAGGLRIDGLYYIVRSLLKVVDHYIIGALTNAGNISVIVFTLLIGAMVAVISRNGGMGGVVNKLSRYARSARSAQLTTWLLGMVIFFDGYANIFIIGNTMRAITDKFRISREKLAYIVDSTTSPVAAVAFISTWIGAELGYIDSGLQALSGYEANKTAYAFFLQSLQYAFYPFLTLIFIFIIVYLKRDFGSMYRTEYKTRQGKTSSSMPADSEIKVLAADKGVSKKWSRAAIPVLVLILMTVYGLIDTGLHAIYIEMTSLNIPVASPEWADVLARITALPGQDGSFFTTVGKVIGAADSYAAMLWASLSSLLAAIFMTIFPKIMSVKQTVGTMIKGFEVILPGLLILVFAWALAQTIGELHTATYLSSLMEHALHPKLMPVLTFILAAGIAFSTGSSWSVMAILYPIVIPTTWAIAQAAGMDLESSQQLLAHVISVVLAASVLGDHCSPISDTTILSSIATGCNHIDHVRTQLPYALTVGGVSLLLCALSAFFEGGWLLNFLLLLLGTGILYTIVIRFGKQIPDKQFFSSTA